MHHRLTAIGLLLLSATTAAHADGTEPPALHTGPTLDLGYTLGGENLDRPDLAKDHTGDRTYLAGEGFSTGVGMVELFGDSGFGLKQELGFWFQDPFIADLFGGSTPSRSDLYFQHTFGNVLALYQWGDESVGVGSTYQTYLELSGSGTGNNVLSDFENAHGWMVQWQKGLVTFRFTHIQYRVKNSNITLDGSNLGLYLTLQFH